MEAATMFSITWEHTTKYKKDFYTQRIEIVFLLTLDYFPFFSNSKSKFRFLNQFLFLVNVNLMYRKMSKKNINKVHKTKKIQSETLNPDNFQKWIKFAPKCRRFIYFLNVRQKRNILAKCKIFLLLSCEFYFQIKQLL